MGTKSSAAVSDRTSVRRWAPGVWAAGLCLMTVLTPPAWAADNCRFLLDSMLNMMATSVHSYTTMTSDIHPTPTRTEAIWVKGTGYLGVEGKWRRSMTLAEIKAQSEENLKTQKPVCSVVRDDSVDGQAATVYIEKSSAGATLGATIWIAKGSGMPLKQEIDMNVGGTKGKSHIATRYTYGNVTVPPGVN